MRAPKEDVLVAENCNIRAGVGSGYTRTHLRTELLDLRQRHCASEACDKARRRQISRTQSGTPPAAGASMRVRMHAEYLHNLRHGTQGSARRTGCRRLRPHCRRRWTPGARSSHSDIFTSSVRGIRTYKESTIPASAQPCKTLHESGLVPLSGHLQE